ncbi:glycosyltransferase [Mucilaginibacter sp. L3T2-6]|uniref:glycosyltransferase n=1 Tax=Mucilaginibacter sp. L3T2-6 TaxID=3062491 RepID=UPI0026759BFC|nr:glycosyltransferase [Mucilaginibacter sp. L3T2-6]MDO3644417.1 glycosyltransferase [Mucilaginibacter sp. L3T2-6]MDV6216869.1 glycosyltransferase [Mucilaginibacter sp. L3T2-6]
MKKVFLIIASLGAGGSERVFWLLSQYFDKSKYKVTVVLLDGRQQSFSSDVEGVEFIDLKTIKASKAFFKIYHLLRSEKPYAVFSTTDHINILTAMVACFLPIPKLICRASNNPHQMKKYYDYKSRFYNLFTRFFALRFDFIVCQSYEMKKSMNALYGIRKTKLKVIPNPVLYTPVVKKDSSVVDKKRLIIVARLSEEKGVCRLLPVMQELPDNYVLTIAGDGPLMAGLKAEVSLRKLESRVTFLGRITNVPSRIAQHDLLLLSSFTEGFPNVILEALSVGVPVVTFRVGGVDDIVRNGFNGFIVKQGDLLSFKNQIIHACSRSWSHDAIKADISSRFDLNKIGKAYENLLL